jgi:putative peptide zinc metalloprotease protein
VGRADDAAPVSTASETTTDTPAPTSSEGFGESPDGVTAGGGGGGTVNNVVVVKNTTDGRVASKVGSGIARVTGDSSHNQNAAVAASSCTDCRSVAVAVQIVLVQRPDASTIAPENYAMAINQSCLRCETFAAAYQYVVTTEGIVHFTAEGNQRLAALESELRSLVAMDGLPFPELDARASAIVQEMWAVVDNELVLAGVKGQGVEHKDVESDVNDTTATPTVSMSPAATESASTEPTDPPTSEPSETPAESESPSPTPSEEANESPSPSPTQSP